jgi:hypothetical protein
MNRMARPPKREAAVGNNGRCARRRIVGLATTVLATAVFVAGALGMAAGAAQAQPGFVPLDRWCPGDYVFPTLNQMTWDWGVCHDWHFAYYDDPTANQYKIVEGVGPPPAPCPPSILPCL